MSSHRSSGGALRGSENSVSWTKSVKGQQLHSSNIVTVNASSTPTGNPTTPTIKVNIAVPSAEVSNPLTIANLAALPSSFSSSVLSTTPGSEDESSSELSYSTSSSSEVPSIASSVDETKFLSSIFGPAYFSEFSKHGVKVVSLPADVAEDLPTSPAGSAAILSSPAHDTKTLYYLAPSDPTKLDRESLVDLMELADEDLECNGIVICLDRRSSVDKEELAETLHSLMYVGGNIVAPDAGMLGFNSEDYILVGLDL